MIKLKPVAQQLAQIIFTHGQMSRDDVISRATKGIAYNSAKQSIAGLMSAGHIVEVGDVLLLSEPLFQSFERAAEMKVLSEKPLTPPRVHPAFTEWTGKHAISAQGTRDTEPVREFHAVGFGNSRVPFHRTGDA